MTDNEMQRRYVSQCSSADWCRGYNEAVEEANEIINRQKAEIERLRQSRNRWKQLAEDFDRISREEEVGKAEAVKEFAERLKENFKPLNSPLIENRIDNLLKETVGDE